MNLKDTNHFMDADTAYRLTQRLTHINITNDFDLDWRVVVVTPEKDAWYIEIYERAEKHILTSGPPDEILDRLTDALPGWGLIEPIVHNTKPL